MKIRLIILLTINIITILFSQTASKVFYSYYGTGTTNYIYSANLDGSDETYFTLPMRPKAIAIDCSVNPAKLYIGYIPVSGNGKIIKCNLDGTNQEDVVTDQVGINDIELDLKYRKIYWLQNTYNDDRIFKADMDGLNSNIVQIYATTVTNRDLWGLALDTVTQRIWITERGSNCYASYIRRMTTSGASLTIIKNPVCNPHDIEYFNNKIYWYDQDGINSANTDGSDQTLVYGSTDADGVAIDETNNRIYWADYYLGKVKRVNFDGSNYFQFSHSRSGISQIVVAYKMPPKILRIRALIEGLYNTVTDKMIADTIIVVVRDTISPFDKKDSVKTVLDSTGTTPSIELDNVSNGKGYYLTIYHRNALETWSGQKPQFVNDSLYYNFTNAASKAYGENMVFKTKNWCLYSGDVNHDGQISLDDLLLIDVDNQNFETGYLATDINGDGQITLDDLLITDINNQNFIGVIRP